MQLHKEDWSNEKRQLWFGIILLLGITFLCIASASASGWTVDHDHLMYWEGSTIDTAKKGTQTIDGRVYYFTADGFLQGNGSVQYISEEYYYIDASNTLLYKWQTIEGKRYYFRPESGKALRVCDMYSYEQEEFAPYNDGRPGWNTYASWKVDGIWYVFGKDGSLQINKWCVGYYGNSDGIILTGYQKVKDY